MFQADENEQEFIFVYYQKVAESKYICMVYGRASSVWMYSGQK